MAGANVETGAKDIKKEENEKQPIPKCIVYFRPHSEYNGEFGFDWLRAGIPPENKLSNDEKIGYKEYKDTILAAYKKIDNQYQDLLGIDAYNAFKKEYKKIPKPIKGFAGLYHIPYLNLFSKTYSNTIKIEPPPTYEAKLKLWVEIKDADVDKIQLEFNKEIFIINGNQSGEFELSNKTKSSSLQSSDEITITCLKDITKNEEIRAYAYFKDSKEEEKKEIAGKILALKNDNNTVRKETKFVFVCVKTKVQNTEKIGKIKDEEIKQLRNTLYQALVRPLIWVKRKNNNGIYEEIVLDLSDEPEYKFGGTYIDPAGNIDEDVVGIFSDLKDKFMNHPDNLFYANNECIPVFIFEDNSYDVTYGMAESFGGPKSILLFEDRLPVTRYEQIIGHEALHCFGLRHTFREENPINDDRQKYIFKTPTGNNATDNAMTYNWGYMITTWNWQWKIIRKYI